MIFSPQRFYVLPKWGHTGPSHTCDLQQWAGAQHKISSIEFVPIINKQLFCCALSDTPLPRTLYFSYKCIYLTLKRGGRTKWEKQHHLFQGTWCHTKTFSMPLKPQNHWNTAYKGQRKKKTQIILEQARGSDYTAFTGLHEFWCPDLQFFIKIHHKLTLISVLIHKETKPTPDVMLLSSK